MKFYEIIYCHIVPFVVVVFLVFFETPRWSAFVLQTCYSKKRTKAPIECDRSFVIRIEIDDKNFSALSKNPLNQHFLKSLWRILGINVWWRFFFVKAIIHVLYFVILGLHCRRIPDVLKATCQIEFVFD